MTARWTRLNHVGKYIRTINQKVRTGASLPEALHFAVEFVDRKVFFLLYFEVDLSM